MNHDTWREPRGPWVLPGTYRVRLIVEGDTATQPLVVRMDPRVKAGPLALQRQYAIAHRMMVALGRDSAALADARALRQQAGAGARSDSLAALMRDLTRLNGQLAGTLQLVEGADAAPTTQAAQGAAALERALAEMEARLAALRR